jgi:iron complex outermembrane receptor protein
LTALFFASPLRADEADEHGSGEGDLADLDLEALMQIEVTSVSKRAQKWFETAAAVTVISNEDIRRSGMTTIPDLLRMVPGLHVANIDANRWAVSARGFNQQFSNKLLVMIDGRTVYTPLFSGTFWDVQDTLFEDIERIEVVRGPGGTVWGANAVNGVINIITKDAKDTQGLLLTGSGGNIDNGSFAGRVGQSIGDDFHFRLYMKRFNRDNFDSARVKANDDWRQWRGGLRMDWDITADDALTLQGDYYDGRSDETLRSLAPTGREDHQNLSGGNVLARYTHIFSETQDISFQTYYDRTERYDSLFREDRNTFDIEFQHRFRPFAWNEVIWGASYRWTSDDFNSKTPGLVLNPPSQTDHLASLFVQNEITLIEGLATLTIGSKLEHNDYTGWEVQPSARVLLTPHPRHTVWGAVSRAVRTPSRADDGILFFTPPDAGGDFDSFAGSNSFVSEDLISGEIGYRTQPIEDVTIDLTAFYNHYDDLRSSELISAVDVCPPFGCIFQSFMLDNRANADTWGIEASATWNPIEWLKLGAGYTLLKVDASADASSTDPNVEEQEHTTPTHQFFVRSWLDLPWNFEFDTALYYVGQVNTENVGAYTRLDLRLGWKPIPPLELSVVGQNLLERRHPEYGIGFFSFSTEVPRSVYGKATWRY